MGGGARKCQWPWPDPRQHELRIARSTGSCLWAGRVQIWRMPTERKAIVKPARAATAGTGVVVRPVRRRAHTERSDTTLAILWAEECVCESVVKWPCDVMNVSRVGGAFSRIWDLDVSKNTPWLKKWTFFFPEKLQTRVSNSRSEMAPMPRFTTPHHALKSVSLSSSWCSINVCLHIHFTCIYNVLHLNTKTYTRPLC